MAVPSGEALLDLSLAEIAKQYPDLQMGAQEIERLPFWLRCGYDAAQVTGFRDIQVVYGQIPGVVPPVAWKAEMPVPGSGAAKTEAELRRLTPSATQTAAQMVEQMKPRTATFDSWDASKRPPQSGKRWRMFDFARRALRAQVAFG